ncbi:WD repeat-containing protein 68 [Strigomonas culicis]|uniref:WD repeat-containing protein 68 n=1 Tax=Strigomonas culicis TaxID=28005 RepID=S9UVY4_9TRYP|nr:WD repeat-containing protein 68 [Strigomonas culicis]EPY25712.1 WD repeat-containing protein 68 [Strigomonas culicis]EPY32951.1 WD repeat-containing protein 68 [Strigomonas culicis]EPY35062.1 WD repeat-containing protein 68 [Strigomonas culicis]EPY36289.1 WD repeat-containing protein 68 [Strigomonas culicis]|eukprot:EPY22352.1 WD repeat-containing protein 68 [Strigomonas culicis]
MSDPCPSSRTTKTSLKYKTSWVANSLSWCGRDDIPFRLVVSSFVQDYLNFVEIIEKDENDQLICRAMWEHCYPPTKTMFSPKKMANDYIITTADYLRLWEITDLPPSEASDTEKGRTIQSKATVKRVFDNGRPNEVCSPITSCDWNRDNLSIVGCCSLDTTVTIWDLESNQQKTKLVAHDKEVYDMAFAVSSSYTFASCGADGSVRLFDLRDMDHCTILYETNGLSPLLRVAWNQQDSNYISTFGIESAEAVVVDIRYPSVPASVLSNGHKQPINGMAWSPSSAQNICTVGEDAMACIWDANADVSESKYQFTCETPINNVVWRVLGENKMSEENWFGITTSEGVQLLRF